MTCSWASATGRIGEDCALELPVVVFVAAQCLHLLDASSWHCEVGDKQDRIAT